MLLTGSDDWAWPKPTWMHFSENCGSIDAEWIFGRPDSPDRFRITYSWIPGEGVMILRTSMTGQEYFEEKDLETFGPNHIAETLDAWLRHAMTTTTESKPK